MKAEYFYDDFSSFDAAKWNTTNALTGVVNSGYMRIRPTTGYDFVETNLTYDITGSYFSFKLFQNNAKELGSNEFSFFALIDSSNYFGFDIEGGRTLADAAPVHMYEKVAGTATNATFIYDPDVHIWFRIREASGTIYWETSTDATTWTVQRSKTTTLTLTAVYCQLGAGYWDAEAGTTFARIDDFNLFAGIPIPPPNAKTETLTDDFEAALDPAKWVVGGDGAVGTSGGKLGIISTDQYYSITSVDDYDLVDSQIAIELTDNMALGNGTYITSLSFVIDGNNTYVATQIEATGGYLYFVERIDGVNSTVAISLSPERHRWFRIRTEGSIIYWETSIDGEYWTTRRMQSTTLDLSAGKIKIESGFYGTETDQTVYLDNFNVISPDSEVGPDLPFKAERLVDTFSTFDETKWWADGWTVEDGNLKSLASGVDYTYIVSLEKWDLTESYFMIELVHNANAGTAFRGNVTSEFDVKVDIENIVRFIISGGDYSQILCRERVDGVNSDTFATYISAKHKWIRIREHDGTIYWEASANAVTWDVFRRKVSTLDLTSVQLLMTCGHWDSEETDAGYVLLDNLNTPDLTLQGQLGWNAGNHLPFGAFDGGTVQARNIFPEAEWLWGAIPDDPVLDPLSTQISSYLTTADPRQHHPFSWGWFANAFVNFYEVFPDTPRYYVNFIGPTEYPDWGFNGEPFHYAVPIPYGTQIPPGWDGHLCVCDPVTKKVFSFWQCFYDADNDEWYASWGGIADFYGDGRDYAGSATATNLSRFAGVATTNEIIAGEIPHALFVSSNMVKPSKFRYPAQKTDGKNMAGIPVEFTIEQGCRLQLDPSINLESIAGITQIELTMGRAWQKYGAYVGDQGGNPWPPTVSAGGVELWQGMDYTEWRTYEMIDNGHGSKTINWLPYDDNHYPPVPPPYAQVGVGWDYFGLDNIPWNDENGNSNIRVLKNWNGK